MPPTESLTDLGVRDAADALRRRTITSVALVEACLARIRELDPKIQAWAHLDADGALAAARERDAESAAGRVRGPLHGVPVGIKDIIDVAGMPTTAGARIVRGVSQPEHGINCLSHACETRRKLPRTR